jgi:integrase
MLVSVQEAVMEYLELTDLTKLIRTIFEASKTSEAAKADHLIALLGFTTGARISQILALRGEDITTVNGKLAVKIHARKRGDDDFKDLRFDSDPAFDLSPLVALAAKRPTSLLFGQSARSNFNFRLKKYCAAAGLHSDFGHSHVLRHSAAMAIYDATQRLGAVSQFLQHRSPATATIYLRENDGKRAQAAMNSVIFS